jgi:hypothetical protein
MEKRQRIIIFGNSLILGAIGASLRHWLDAEIVHLSQPLPKAQELSAMSPDVVIYDLEGPQPESKLALLQGQHDLLLLGVHPSNHELMILSSHIAQACSIVDLVKVILH